MDIYSTRVFAFTLEEEDEEEETRICIGAKEQGSLCMPFSCSFPNPPKKKIPKLVVRAPFTAVDVLTKHALSKCHLPLVILPKPNQGCHVDYAICLCLS